MTVTVSEANMLSRTYKIDDLTIQVFRPKIVGLSEVTFENSQGRFESHSFKPGEDVTPSWSEARRKAFQWLRFTIVEDSALDRHYNELSSERGRLERQISKLQRDMEGIDHKLNQPYLKAAVPEFGPGDVVFSGTPESSAKEALDQLLDLLVEKKATSLTFCPEYHEMAEGEKREFKTAMAAASTTTGMGRIRSLTLDQLNEIAHLLGGEHAKASFYVYRNTKFRSRIYKLEVGANRDIWDIDVWASSIQD